MKKEKIRRFLIFIPSLKDTTKPFIIQQKWRQSIDLKSNWETMFSNLQEKKETKIKIKIRAIRSNGRYRKKLPVETIIHIGVTNNIQKPNY